MNNLLNNFYINNISFSIVVVAVVIIVSLIIKKFIDFIFLEVANKVTHKDIAAKTQMARFVLKSTTDIAMFTIAILIVLSYWGVDITPILTGAGILGLVVSLGAQNLVKDFISGIFIIADSHFNIGDEVKINNHEGRVMEITLRSVTLQDKQGNQIFIPNSLVSAVTKYNGS